MHITQTFDKMATIPVIDFGAFGLKVKNGSEIGDDALKSLGDEVKSVLSTVGFCYLKNHGVNEDLVKDYMKVSREFFEQPEDVKRRYAMSTEVKAGWVGFGHETLNPVRPADLKESFSYAPSYKVDSMPTVPNFEPLMKKLFEECTRLCYRFLEVLSIGLGLPRDFMGNAHRLIGRDGNPTALRSLYYPALPAESKFTAGEIRCGEHTDYGTVTFLFQDDVGGLDVKSPGAGFIPANPIPGTVVVNIGSLLQRWTSDTLIATEHRVLIPEEEIRRKTARQSVVFFALSDDEYVVKCLDGSEKYEHIKTIDYLNYRFESAYTNY